MEKIFELDGATFSVVFGELDSVDGIIFDDEMKISITLIPQNISADRATQLVKDNHGLLRPRIQGIIQEYPDTFEGYDPNGEFGWIATNGDANYRMIECTTEYILKKIK